MATEKLKQDFLFQLEYIKVMGSKIFLYPFVGRSRTTIWCYYFVYSLLLLTSTQLFLTFCVTVTGHGDMLEIINLAPNIGACMMSLIKYTTLHTNKELYDKIIHHFQEDMWELIPYHYKENLIITQNYTNVSKKLNRFLTYFAVILITIVDSFPWIIMTYEHKFLQKDLQYLSPFDAWYPFDRIKWYGIAYFWESIMTAAVILIYAFSNLVHISVITFICMELRLLGNCLEELISPDDVRDIRNQKRIKETNDNIKKNLKNFIKRHEFLEKISSSLDEVLGDAMLLSYTSGSIFICLTAFSSTVVDDLYKSLRYFSFFLSLILEIFMQCIIGQVLVDHSEALVEKIYSSEWIYADDKTKKILLMLMMRTQKPFKLTANRYLTMDLNTFNRICASSYQFFNLLRTIYHP